MVNDTHKAIESLVDELISYREGIVDKTILQHISDKNQQNLERIISDAEGKKHNLQSIISESEKKTLDLYYNSISAVVYALEARDKYSSDHSRRVATIAAAIAKVLGLPSYEVDKIAIAGLVHDIGKIGVKESVLHKQGKLNDEEFLHLMSHCEIGERILRPIVTDIEVLDIVRHHHEHYDGTGYPDGLSHKQVFIAAESLGISDAYTGLKSRVRKGGMLSQNTCILAVADAFDSMMFPDTFRSAPSTVKVAEEIVSRAGSQFDPEAAEALLEIADSLSPFFREAEEKAEQEAEAERQAEKEAMLAFKEKARQEAEVRKQIREAEKQAEKEARIALKEREKQEAEARKQAKEAEKQAEKEAKIALKEKEKQEAEARKHAQEAEKQAEKEARIALEEKARREAEAREAEKEAMIALEEKARQEAEARAYARDVEKVEQDVESNSSDLYKGDYSLVLPLVDLVQLKQFKRYLEQIKNLKIVLTRGLVEEDGGIEVIHVLLQKPTPLIHLLRIMPIVDGVDLKGANIFVVLKDLAVGESETA